MAKTDTQQSSTATQTQLAELENKWKRALADYQNLEKRVVQERGQFLRLATVGVIEKFLEVLDNLERAADHLADDGLAMVVKQFHSVLESEGVTEILALEQEFDPHTMEAVDKAAGKVNTVVSVTKKGYRLGDTIIRPAKVVVGGKE